MSRSLTLYARSYCHLCEVMESNLRALQPSLGFALDTVDVDEDPELVARFDELVPVLADGEQIICHHHLDLGRLRAHLGRH